MDGDILFSYFIVVFQLQKEMRKGVCAFVREFLPQAGTHRGEERSARLSRSAGGGGEWV